MRNSIFGIGGSLTALATPFRDTEVDWKALCRLSERQIDRGTAALIVCGSTGEAASMILSEYTRAVRTVAEVAAGRVAVIVGCTALATTAAIAMGTEAASAGADALLCAVPPYVKPTQEGIMAHIRAVAHATDLPIVLYDIPSRSGVAITDDTVARLHHAELIVGLKDATADLSRRADEAARPSQPFQVVQAVCISREPSLKLPRRLRVVDAGMGTFHCPSPRSTPVKWIPRDVRYACSAAACSTRRSRSTRSSAVW